jgi:hypothetical protein
MGGRELIVPDPISRHLKAVFDKGNAPVLNNRDSQGRILELQIPIPGKVMKMLDTVSNRMVCIDSSSF